MEEVCSKGKGLAFCSVFVTGPTSSFKRYKKLKKTDSDSSVVIGS
jgi:hypothetical protein